jgi:Adenylate cyclase, family 3 (some proteins contain HAMP domain)
MTDRPELAAADAASRPDLPALLERVESVILGGPRRYTAAEVAERAGLTREEARRLWRALGFATVDEGDVVFTDADVTALRDLGRLADFGLADEELRLAVTRLFGQVFSRLASYQGQLMLEQVAKQPELLASGDGLTELVERVTPIVEHLQGYAWRRQLAAYLARMAAQGSDEMASGPAPLAIGFADLSGFTALTRRLSEAELRELLEVFETFSTEIVGAHGGRIVKTIGDEILFQVDDPGAAAEIALELIEAADRHDDLPALRAGLAYGPVVSRLGDVYGSTVNIASRLTSLSRRGWVLVDREMHDALAGDPRFHLRSRRPESVRGFHHLRPWRLRRATP